MSPYITTATFSFIYGIKMIAKGNQLGYTISPEVSSKMYRATGVSLIALGTASLFPSSLITLIGMFHELGSPGVVAFGVGSIGISILGITQGIKMVRKGNKIRDTNITTAPLIDPFSHRYGMIVCFEF